jgi:hypothetical protein
MSDLNDRFTFERLVRRIDDPSNKAVVVVLVNEDETIDTAVAGIDNAVGLWSIFFSLAAQLSDEIIADMTPEQRAGMRIMVPTREQVDELGLRRVRRTSS